MMVQQTASPQEFTYTYTVGRVAGFFVVVPHFVEIVFVELANEAGEIAVLEVFRKYGFCEFFVLSKRVSVS